MQKYLIKKFGRTGFNVLGILALFVVVLVIGVLFYHYVEHFKPIDAVYFTAMTLATVGYGDLAPQSDGGKLFTAIYALIGVAIFFGLAAAVFAWVLERLQKKRRLWPKH